MKFKTGDKVKCIDPIGTSRVLQPEYEYIVDDCDAFEENISLCGIQNSYFHHNRFQLVEHVNSEQVKPSPQKPVLSLESYSKDARKTMGKKHSVEYLLIGLSSEAEFKKVYEGKSKKVDKEALRKELGDCLWYLNAIAVSQGITLESVAVENLIKVFSRKEAKKFKERLNKIEKKFKGD